VRRHDSKFPEGYTLWQHKKGVETDPANPQTDAYLHGAPLAVFHDGVRRAQRDPLRDGVEALAKKNPYFNVALHLKLMDEFDLSPTLASAIPVPGAWAAATGEHAMVFAAYPRGSAQKEKTRPLMSFVAPSAGMFVWVELYFGDVPDQVDEDGTVLNPERQFWTRLADAGVLTAPGWFFDPAMYALDGAASGGTDRQIGHLRLSYTPSDVSAVEHSFCPCFVHFAN